jgi:hypothetical protein
MANLSQAIENPNAGYHGLTRLNEGIEEHRSLLAWKVLRKYYELYSSGPALRKLDPSV